LAAGSDRINCECAPIPAGSANAANNASARPRVKRRDNLTGMSNLSNQRVKRLITIPLLAIARPSRPRPTIKPIAAWLPPVGGSAAGVG